MHVDEEATFSPALLQIYIALIEVSNLSLMAVDFHWSILFGGLEIAIGVSIGTVRVEPLITHTPQQGMRYGRLCVMRGQSGCKLRFGSSPNLCVMGLCIMKGQMLTVVTGRC